MNILISSAGRRGALVKIFQRSLHSTLGEGRVLAADASPLSAAGALADDFEIVPPCLSEEFVAHMLELCERHSVGLVVPTIDTELPVYAAHRDAFAAIGTTVLISAPETVELTTNKRLTSDWLTDRGLPTMRTAELSDVLADAHSWQFPVIAKPAQGSGSAGVALIESWAALKKLPVEPDVIVQELAAGDEYTVDAWVDRDGYCACTVPRRRLEVRSGEVQKSLTVRWPAMETLVREVVQKLPGAFGPMNVQVFANGDSFQIIEINARFGGGYPLSWQAGADFARWAIEVATGLPPTTCDNWRSGLAMLRYDEAVFVAGNDVGL